MWRCPSDEAAIFSLPFLFSQVEADGRRPPPLFSRHMGGDSQFKIQNSKFKIQNSQFTIILFT